MGSAGVIFTNLDPEEKYWPQVQRETKDAFFGIGPWAMKPVSVPVVEDERSSEKKDEYGPPLESDLLYTNSTGLGSAVHKGRAVFGE